METNKMEELIKSIENLEDVMDEIDTDITKISKCDVVYGRSSTIEELYITLQDFADKIKFILSDIEYGVELIEKFSK